MKRVLYLLTIFISTSLISVAQTIENPVFDRTDVPAFHINKVTINKDATILHCSYAADANSWANISDNTYLLDTKTNKSYPIQKSEGIPYAPEQRNFLFGERCEVTLYFPSFDPQGKLDLIENKDEKAFNVYGISMLESNDSICREYSIERAVSFSKSASFYDSSHNYLKAIEYEEQAMSIFRYWLGRYNEKYDHSVFMLGYYYSMLENYDKAEYYLKESVEVRKALYGEGQEPYAVSLTQLANCFMSLNKISKAITIYEQAINSLENNLNHYNLSYTRAKSLLAQAYYSLGDIPKAIQYTEDVVKINKSLFGENDEEYILPFMSLAQYLLRSDLSKAELAYQDLVSVIKLKYGKEDPMYLLVINGLAQCYLLQNKLEKALNIAREIEKLVSKMYGENSKETGLLYDLKSQIYAFMHDYEKAIDFGLASLEIFKPTLSGDAYSNSLSIIADYYAKKGDFNNAYKFADIAINVFKEYVIQEFVKLSEDQKYSLWQKRHFLFDSGYIFYAANCMNNAYIGELYNNALFFKGITLRDGMSDECTWENIKESLNDSDIAIEFLASHEQDSLFCYYAVLIRKDYKYPKMFRLFDISQFGELLKKDMTKHEIDIQLGNLIWGKMEKELIGIKNIYFSPSGMFLKIGIEYLPIDNETVYEDKFNLFRLSSTTELLQKTQQCQYNKAFLFGGLDYNDPFEIAQAQITNKTRSGFDMLSNSYDEVSSISKTLNGNHVNCKIFSGLDGTENVFKMLEKEDFEILHFATHGENVDESDVEMMKDSNNLIFLKNNSKEKYFVYEKDAMSWSYLVMSGGNKLVNRVIISSSTEDDILTAAEISNMRFSHLDLVVLSACKTALGQQGIDNSILGLQRGFKKAGANTILMSLDKVDDEATKILMVEFYKNLMNGKSKFQSLKEAQKYLRQVDNGKYDKPEYWASFIMLDGLN